MHEPEKTPAFSPLDGGNRFHFRGPNATMTPDLASWNACRRQIPIRNFALCGAPFERKQSFLISAVGLTINRVLGTCPGQSLPRDV
jgi:hypothetical protein